MDQATPADEHVLVERQGPIVTLTFNRPEARNAMTWGMYQRLYEACEEVDADDSIRVLVLKGAGGKAFVAGTEISQFTAFQSGEDGLRYERDNNHRAGRIARVRKPVIAQIQGVAVGGGLGIAAGADIRIATPDARFGLPMARTLGNCLSMQAYATFMELFGPSRFKEMMFTARLLSVKKPSPPASSTRSWPQKRSRRGSVELAQTIASHAPITLWVTKEAVRRIQEARPSARWRGPDPHHLRQRRLSRRRQRLRGQAAAALDRPLGSRARSTRRQRLLHHGEQGSGASAITEWPAGSATGAPSRPPRARAAWLGRVIWSRSPSDQRDRAAHPRRGLQAAAHSRRRPGSRATNRLAVGCSGLHRAASARGCRRAASCRGRDNAGLAAIARVREDVDRVDRRAAASFAPSSSSAAETFIG